MTSIYGKSFKSSNRLQAFGWRITGLYFWSSQTIQQTMKYWSKSRGGGIFLLRNLIVMMVSILPLKRICSNKKSQLSSAMISNQILLFFIYFYYQFQETYIWMSVRILMNPYADAILINTDNTHFLEYWIQYSWISLNCCSHLELRFHLSCHNKEFCPWIQCQYKEGWLCFCSSEVIFRWNCLWSWMTWALEL